MNEAFATLARAAGDIELARRGTSAAEIERFELTEPTTISLDPGVCARAGRALWEASRGGDDRRLYWRRLAGVHSRLESVDAFTAFEFASRGFVEPTSVASDSIVVVTGFDPFHLDDDVGQSNPSGHAALALDGETIGAATIIGAVFPVRFDAFDRGVVEAVLGGWTQDPRVRAIVTVSMGRDGFDLERFPGRRRSSDALDNARAHGGWSATNPVPSTSGPEFVEFSLPVDHAARVAGPFAVRDNHRVRTLEDGWIEVEKLADLAGKTAVDGSGGGYLSNEIAYRVARLRDRYRPDLAVGHIHTPRVVGAPAEQLDAIVAQTRDLIEAVVVSL